jgi:hypothetical protein
MTSNIYETVLAIQAISFKNTLPGRTAIYGSRCEIYLAQPSTSDWNNDSKFEYLSTPAQTKQLLIVNDAQKAFLGDLTYDPFSPEQKEIITDYDNRLTQNSKIVAFKGSSYTEYVVDVPEVINGKDGPILVRNKLIPYV